MTALTSLTARSRWDEANAFERDLIEGLSDTPRSIAPKYFYDADGSALFDRICRTPEYYPTRTEKRILSEYAVDMAEMIGSSADIVEFGAGSLEKIRILLDSSLADSGDLRYLPVDISREYLERSAVALQAIYPGLAVEPIAADFTQPFGLPEGRRRVGFFPGSTLGNFHPNEALRLLRQFATMLRGGGLLIGIDLVKDPAILHAAYNDAAGVTAEFNRNLLKRANREAHADFHVDACRHYAFYQPSLRRVEMHLVSARRQVVTINGNRFVFSEGDSIHTENSYKYSIDAIRDLAIASGFLPTACWTDPHKLFSVHWLEAI
jgi:dimethylhistidine N-methyltransferase